MILEESVLYLFRGVVINFYTLFGGVGKRVATHGAWEEGGHGRRGVEKGRGRRHK